MAEVINFSRYASLRSSSGTQRAETAPDQETWFTSSESSNQGRDFLSPSALRKLDDQNPLGRLLELIEASLLRLEACLGFLAAGDNFAADDEFMGCKKLFSEMLMFRDTSEAVGLLSMKGLSGLANRSHS